MVNYETLYGILRKEKYQVELQKLDKTFFQDVNNYLIEKEKILESQKQKGTFLNEIKKTKIQIKNIKKILKELYEKRENKILQLAVLSIRGNNKDDFTNILQEERQLYKDIKNILNVNKEKILSNILSKKQVIPKPKDIKIENSRTTKLIRFLDSTSKFVGDDLQIYGPYEPESVANLPMKVADILIKRNKAEQINYENSKEN